MKRDIKRDIKRDMKRDPLIYVEEACLYEKRPLR